jgi:hypothetical protein
VDDSWIRGSDERLIGKTYVRGSAAWDKAAVYYSNFLERSLGDLGLPEEDVMTALTLRDEAAEQVRAIDEAERFTLNRSGKGYSSTDVSQEAEMSRRSALSRLTDWFKGREIRVNESTEVEVRVPLFVLAAPAVKGCSATFEESVMHNRALLWNVSILGSGLGQSAELATSASWKFSSSGGEIKVVFIPVSVTIARVTVLEKGQTISEGYQVDASAIKTSSEPGLLLLSPDADPPIGELSRTYPLAGDTTEAIASYEYKYQQKADRHLEIGVTAFHLDAKVRAAVQINGSLSLKYELRGGYDYALHRLTEGDGLLWSTPNRPVQHEDKGSLTK